MKRSRLLLRSVPLAPGVYQLDIGSRSGDMHSLDYNQEVARVEIISGPSTPGHIVRPESGTRLGVRLGSSALGTVSTEDSERIGQRIWLR
jgi:hypothetical protein